MPRAVSSTSRPTQIPEGFRGQRVVALPSSVVRDAIAQPLFAGLVPTDIGIYPNAEGHRRERPVGATETIFIHCAAGAGWCDLGGRRHVLKQGDLLAVPPGRAHAYGADPRNPWTIRWFHVVGGDLSALLHELELSEETPARPLPGDATLALLFDQALSVLEQGYARAHLLCASRALGCYLAHAAWLVRHAPLSTPDARGRITRCIDYMRGHLDRPLRLEELAAIAHWSPSHFKARFREHTGYGCIDYFIRLRIHAACQLLDTTTLDIQAIAARVGYADPLWFSKAFKKVTGLPPSAYRLKHKG